MSENERLCKAEERIKFDEQRIDRLERLADEVRVQNENIARLVTSWNSQTGSWQRMKSGSAKSKAFRGAVSGCSSVRLPRRLLPLSSADL